MIYTSKRPILYVDDTVEQRYAMRRILEIEGFEVLEAGSGKEAFAQIDDSVALAVVDVRLPDINGYDLTSRLKKARPNLPVLQVSASFSNPELRAAGFSGGADAYIAQPVHPSELVSLIRRMLRAAEVEGMLRFLAEMSPKITSSLSVEQTIAQIQSVVVPKFADRCAICLRGVAGEPPCWYGELGDAADRRAEIESKAVVRGPRLLTQRLLAVPLSEDGSPLGLGCIAFELDEGRQYTESDLVLAADLASRFGLVLQNCILFAAEQSTRSALVQSEKLATAGRMSAAIAHEINNPLEAITNLLFIIEQDPEVPVAMRDHATSALAEVTRLAHITRQSLGFYKELGAPSIVDLSRSVSDTVDLYQKRLTRQRISVMLELGPECTIRGIAGEIRQVISNLLLNAIEAISEDGAVSICTRRQNDSILLTMKDTGPGIHASMRARVFEPFFTTKQGTGTGLGLWITQTIIEKHHGEIRLVEDPDDGGCEFQITLPTATEQELPG